MFDSHFDVKTKNITSEVCIHHLWFSDADYDEKGSLIKWNPAVKTAQDRHGLWTALNDDRIDIIATDHAPHTMEEKMNPYTKLPRVVQWSNTLCLCYWNVIYKEKFQ